MSRRIELVVFDVGSVLVRAGRSWHEEASLAGFDLDPAWLEAFESRLRGRPRLTLGEISVDDYCAMLAAASDGALTPGDVRRITAASLIDECAGVGAVLDAVEAAGVETALLMNLNELEWARYFPPDGSPSAFPTVSRARYRFASHLMGVAKPDRRAYENVERGTGTRGDAVLFFDDRVENVEAARALGWRAEQVDHAGDTALQLLAFLRGHGVTSV